MELLQGVIFLLLPLLTLLAVSVGFRLGELVARQRHALEGVRR